MAHRGLSGEVSENTVAAFRAAADAGFRAIELDLQATRDGVPVVLHDDDLQRTTGTAGNAADLDAKELARRRTQHGPVPPLEDALRELRGWDGLWNLEVKAAAALAPTLELVERFGLRERTLLTCMDIEPLQEAMRRSPHLPRGLITVGWPDESDLEVAQSLECTWLMADEAFLDAGAVRHVASKGLLLGAWTVNDPARAIELAAWGAKCIITDVRAVLGALQPQPKAHGR